jgi:signal transduction histidine kinase/CheY-like chemotaxis protein
MTDPRILVVDDDLVILRVCERILKQASFQVGCTSDPFEAFRMLQEQPFDLLLVDIMMPQMDGFELIGRAKTYQPELAILTMTGFGTVETAIEALRRGVDGLILKPFHNSDELTHAIHQALLQNQMKRDQGRLQALRPLFDVSEAIISEMDLPALLERILGVFQASFQTNMIGIYRMRSLDAVLELVGSRGQFPWVKSCGKKGLIQSLIPEGDSGIINKESCASLRVRTELVKGGLKSVLYARINRGKTALIFFTAHSQNEPVFIQSDFEKFVILARQSAIAIENAGLYEDLRSSLRRIEESQMALVQTEKMAAVGRLVASIAHEINNPLQAVRNCLYLASHEEIPLEQKKDYLDMAHKEMDRLQQTVQRMLDFYRPGRLDREWVDIKWLIDRVLQFLNTQFRDNDIRVQTNIPNPLPRIHVVRDHLQQVFLNLLLNAMDAIKEMEQKVIWIDVGLENNFLKIFIEDSGNGIPPEYEDRIFEPFVSSKTDGTGLGLTISYDLMKTQNGSLRLIESKYGKGARFEIGIPSRGKNG